MKKVRKPQYPNLNDFDMTGYEEVTGKALFEINGEVRIQSSGSSKKNSSGSDNKVMPSGIPTSVHIELDGR